MKPVKILWSLEIVPCFPKKIPLHAYLCFVFSSHENMKPCSYIIIIILPVATREKHIRITIPFLEVEIKG